jgi:glycosyltransferase involved in cell wall biosynthesis
MRIAQVVATFPPYWAGTGNVAYHQSRVLHERGYDVEVFTALPPHEKPLEFPFPVHYLPTWGRLGNAPFTPSLMRHLRGFDLIHLHYPYIFGADLTIGAAKRYHIPVVATYHNDLLGSGVKGLLFDLYNRINQPRILRYATSIMATTKDYAGYSFLTRINGLPIRPIPNAVDPLFLQTIATEGACPLANPFVLFVGAMDNAHLFKGVPILIDAMTSLKKKAVDLILAGDGALREYYMDYARASGIDNAHFVGRVAHQTLQSLYAGAEATILPSTSSTEAFGLVLLESWANKTPVIATRIPGVRELVDDGQDGYLVPPNDPNTLAHAIKHIIDDPEKSRTMGEAGYLKVCDKYTWEHVVDQIEVLYHEVVQTA